jgi:molybdopterin-guanine dinucleotide biosynthesis protein A
MKSSPRTSIEICILAGGLSTRMGRDKAKLRLGNRSLLGHIHTIAKSLRLPVRVIRRDAVPRCGPLGGVVTAMRRSKGDAILFLACDMPFVSADLMHELLSQAQDHRRAFFAKGERTVGFPFVLPRTTLAVVEEQIARGKFSIRSLALALKSRTFKVGRRFGGQLRNINTPADWQTAQRRWKSR